jgi:hypothetical protein
MLDPKVDDMPREAEGLLVRMWCECHRVGYCPADAESLAHKTRCDLQYVLRWKRDCEQFFNLQDGKLYSRRMQEEKQRSEQARKNASVRYKKQTQSESESESESDRGSANGTASCSANRSANRSATGSADGTAKPSARPTLQEVATYCQQRQNHVDPQRWFDHYTANGWRVGPNPMTKSSSSIFRYFCSTATTSAWSCRCGKPETVIVPTHPVP